mmetsp:Transcript_2792/g.5361  ORF Transcript_2792/g.5361 Transcript_2792/m.5361 type:complete len:309 (+) Transcript_2792:1-927(+)
MHGVIRVWEFSSSASLAAAASPSQLPQREGKKPCNVVAKCVFSERCHDLNTPIRSINFSPYNPDHLASGGQDGFLRVWDIRDPYRPLYERRDALATMHKVQWLPSPYMVLTVNESQGAAVHLINSRVKRDIPMVSFSNEDIPISISMIRDTTLTNVKKSEEKLVYRTAVGYSSGIIDVCAFSLGQISSKRMKRFYFAASSLKLVYKPNGGKTIDFPSAKELDPSGSVELRKAGRPRKGEVRPAKKKAPPKLSRKVAKAYSHRTPEELEAMWLTPELGVTCIGWNPHPGLGWCLASATAGGIVRVRRVA